MVRQWIDTIYDRTYGDIRNIQLNPNQENPKGCFNAIDLNRLESNTAYCVEYMLEHKIYRSDPHLTIRENNYWQQNMIPTDTEIRRIINNINTIVEYTRTKQVPEIANKLPYILVSSQMTFNLANDIEYALDILHNQPNLPLDYFKLTIENGTILSVLRADGTTETINNTEVMMAEDEIATIKAIEYGEYAQYQTFINWSATYDPLDLDALDDYESQQTTYTGQYRDVKFVANFNTRIPRTLTLSNSYISVNGDDTAESGPSTGTYYAGDQIMIITNRATNGQAFYEWLGTAEALENIVGASDTDPSTSWLTMPDCNVNLSPHYINAGAHEVVVVDGYGSGWYEYDDYVGISPNDKGEKWEFSHWSGNTSLLSDIYSSYQSFRMPDVNVTLRANYNYVPSYNDVTVICGTINGTSQATNLRETQSYQLVADIPYGMGFDYWSVEGLGEVYSYDNPTTTFKVGDGNAIITAHFQNLRNLVIENINNSGTNTSYQRTQNKSTMVETAILNGNYIFDNWTENGVIKSYYTPYAFTMPERDLILHANYRLRNTVQITIDYGMHVETYSMIERNSMSIIADTAPTGKHFTRWDYSNILSIENRYLSNTSFTCGANNGSLTAVYENDLIYHDLTVNYGTPSGTYAEGSGIRIVANTPPQDYEFDYWSINAGNGTIDNIYAAQSIYRMGTQNGEITANYKLIDRYTVTVQNGYVYDGTNWVTSTSLLKGSQPQIQMKPAPDGHQFLQWEVLVGDNNDVYQPLAETTYIRNLTHNTTVQATYYIPNDEDKYTLTINRWTGEVEQHKYKVGERVEIWCSTPPINMKFYRWEDDYQYLTIGQPAPRYYGGTYQNPQIVNMPARNITITEGEYKPLDWTVKYHLWMVSNSQCLYQTEEQDPNNPGQTITVDHWVTDWEYPEGATVQIRTTAIPSTKRFSAWQAVDDNENDMRSYIAELENPITSLIMPQDDMYVTPLIPDKNKYQMTVYDGGDNIEQYEDGPVNIWFGKIDTNDVHYVFNRWTGDRVSQLKLYGSGRQFNVLIPGTQNQPQQVAMLPYSITLRPSYTTLYHLVITNGIIDSTSSSDAYYEANTVVNITANTAPIGQKFQKWEGDISGIANPYDPTTTVTTVQGVTSIRAKYSLDSDQNDTGYVLTDLSNSNTINNEDIHIISGELKNGFIITDNNGHIYIITTYGSTTSNIMRLTKISKGGNVYE